MPGVAFANAFVAAGYARPGRAIFICCTGRNLPVMHELPVASDRGHRRSGAVDVLRPLVETAPPSTAALRHTLTPSRFRLQRSRMHPAAHPHLVERLGTISPER